MAAHTLDVVVPAEVRTFILEWAQDSKGNGGFQSLYRALASRLKSSKVLHLSPEEIQRITRYAMAYGEGGHQQQLRKLVCSVVAQHGDKLVAA